MKTDFKKYGIATQKDETEFNSVDCALNLCEISYYLFDQTVLEILFCGPCGARILKKLLSE